MMKQAASYGKIVIFTFAGRELYLEIQKDFILDILAKNPRVEYHLWNFSRNESDNLYLQRLSRSMPRTKTFNQFYEGSNPVDVCTKRIGYLCGCKKCRVGKYSEPYKYYSSHDEYRDTIFVKLDDDVVFIETARFQMFADCLNAHRGKIWSANVINNGICAIATPSLKAEIEKAGLIKSDSIQSWWFLCVNVDFFKISHEYFFKHAANLLNQPSVAFGVPRTRFSINTIGFDWETMNAIAEKLGLSPTMNDEGVISENFDIFIHSGFLACHLHYSDQRSNISGDEEGRILAKYKDIKRHYLGGKSNRAVGLPSGPTLERRHRSGRR
jgi:hypothetical protein